MNHHEDLMLDRKELTVEDHPLPACEEVQGKAQETLVQEILGFLALAFLRLFQ